MCGNRLPWPHRTYFFRRVVANGEDKVEFRSTGFSKFVPFFAPQPIYRQSRGFNLANRSAMDFAFRMTSRAVRRERRESLLVHDGFGHDGASGVSGTQEQNVITPIHRGYPQHPDLQHPSEYFGFSPRTKALMNFPSTCGAIASASIPSVARNSLASAAR